MFTPQRKGWSLTPAGWSGQKNGSGSGSEPRNGEAGTKGKGVKLLESATPATGMLGESGGGSMGQEGLVDKVLKLENELFEYQYNMGLLLIEKKEWSSKYDELTHAVQETKDALKREQVAHSIAISQVEKREENLRKALGVEKQCVLDLEKALREMRSEYAEIKFTADLKLAEANALTASIEDKSLEVEAKLRAADAKLAEVSRNSSEIERKSREVEDRENALRRERLSFNSEREVHEERLSKQREDLREWERKLQEGEERLAEMRRSLNQREERANENDRIFKQKQADLEEAQKKIDLANSSLKKKEDDISSRIANLTLKEKEADIMRNRLEMKEKELLELEEKLNAREQVEIQKLLDEHNTILDAKKQDFELEMDQKRKTVDEDLKSKVFEVEKKEIEVNHAEEKIAKREQALEKKAEKVKEKEKDFDSKIKAFKEREKSLRVEEKNLGNEKKQLLSDKENLLSLKVELEKLRADIEEQRLILVEERERLKLTEDERSEHTRLQSQLKQEIDRCGVQRELLSRESEDLKQEREKFEKEWEELDEKRAETKKELEYVTEQKEKLEKLKRAEEERLNNEKVETQGYVQRELEALKQAKDSFAELMEHEKSAMAENIQSEKSQMLQDLEHRKRELETEFRSRKEEMENHLLEKEKLFEEERERELHNINHDREAARQETKEMELERLRIEKEKQEISANQKHLEGQQLEMRKDIDVLVDLSRKLKEQREHFLKERERFVAFVDKHKGCKNCGDATCEFVLSDLQSLTEIGNADSLPLPKLADDYLKEAIHATPERPNSGISPPVSSKSPVSGESGAMSLLQRCKNIFVFSPGKKNEHTAYNRARAAPLPGKHLLLEPPKGSRTEGEPDPSLGIATDSFDVERIQSDNSIREVGAELEPSAIDDQSKIGRASDIMKNSQPSDLKMSLRKPGKKGRARVSRTRSVKAVVAEANALQQNEGEHINGVAENVMYTDEESRGESSLVGKGTSRNGRKRNRGPASQSTASEQDGEFSEEHSDFVAAGGRRKRRQKVAPAVQTPVEKRYNLRRPRIASAVAANGNGAGRSNEMEKAADGGGTREGMLESNAVPAPSTGVASEGDWSTHLMHVKALKSTVYVHESSSQGVLRAKTVADAGAADMLVDDMDLSEEVNGTREEARGYSSEEYRSETPRGDRVGNKEEEDDDDDEEVEHP
ncbi:hypothetical protein RJ640_012132, partial [Escallonia rubra]